MTVKSSTVGVIGIDIDILLDNQKQQLLRTQYRRPPEVDNIISDIIDILDNAVKFVDGEDYDDKLLLKFNGDHKTIDKYIELLRRFNKNTAKTYSIALSDIQRIKLPIPQSVVVDPRESDSFGMIELEKDIQNELTNLIKGLFNIISNNNKIYKLLNDFKSMANDFDQSKNYNFKSQRNTYKQYGPLTGGQWKSLYNIGGPKIIEHINSLSDNLPPIDNDKHLQRVVRRATKFIKNYITTLREQAASQPMSIWIIDKKRYNNQYRVTMENRYTGVIVKKPFTKKPLFYNDADEAADKVDHFVNLLVKEEGYNIIQYDTSAIKDETLEIANKLSAIDNYGFAKFVVGSENVVDIMSTKFGVDEQMSNLVFGLNNENVGEPIVYKPEYIESNFKIPIVIPLKLTNWSPRNKPTTFLDKLFKEIVQSFKNDQLIKKQSSSQYIMTYSSDYGDLFAVFRKFGAVNWSPQSTKPDIRSTVFGEIKHFIYSFIVDSDYTNYLRKYFPANYDLHDVKIKGGNINFIFKQAKTQLNGDILRRELAAKAENENEQEYHQLRDMIRDNSWRQLVAHYEEMLDLPIEKIAKELNVSPGEITTFNKIKDIDD